VGRFWRQAVGRSGGGSAIDRWGGDGEGWYLLFGSGVGDWR
jgi:hypothetical protein